MVNNESSYFSKKIFSCDETFAMIHNLGFELERPDNTLPQKKLISMCYIFYTDIVAIL